MKAKEVVSALVVVVATAICLKIVEAAMQPGFQVKRLDVISYLKQISLSDDGLSKMNSFNGGPQKERATYSRVVVSEPVKRVLWRAEYTSVQPKFFLRPAYSNHVICEVEDKSSKVECFINRQEID